MYGGASTKAILRSSASEGAHIGNGIEYVDAPAKSGPWVGDRQVYTCGPLIPAVKYEHVCVGPNNHIQSRILRPSHNVTANNIHRALDLPSGYPTGGHQSSALSRRPDCQIDGPLAETFGCRSTLASFGDCDGRLETSIEVCRDSIGDFYDSFGRCRIISLSNSRSDKCAGRSLSCLRKVDTVSSTFRL